MNTVRVQSAKVGQVVRHEGAVVTIESVERVRADVFRVTFDGGGFRCCAWGARLFLAA